eukprot:5944970-Pleurochrysis_carterae.AAC.3
MNVVSFCARSRVPVERSTTRRAGALAAMLLPTVHMADGWRNVEKGAFFAERVAASRWLSRQPAVEGCRQAAEALRPYARRSRLAGCGGGNGGGSGGSGGGGSGSSGTSRGGGSSGGTSGASDDGGGGGGSDGGLCVLDLYDDGEAGVAMGESELMHADDAAEAQRAAM